MPPKSLGKVQKQIARKKGSRVALHEKSRDKHRLDRAAARSEKLAKLATSRAKLDSVYSDRVAYFQEHFESHTGPISLSEVHAAIQQYIHRNDGEIQQLQEERRPGRPSSKRQDHLKEVRHQDDLEYTSGFWMPDLQDPKSVVALQRWSGAWDALNTLTFCRISRDGVLKPSKFPPKGTT